MGAVSSTVHEWMNPPTLEDVIEEFKYTVNSQLREEEAASRANQRTQQLALDTLRKHLIRTNGQVDSTCTTAIHDIQLAETLNVKYSSTIQSLKTMRANVATMKSTSAVMEAAKNLVNVYTRLGATMPAHLVTKLAQKLDKANLLLESKVETIGEATSSLGTDLVTADMPQPKWLQAMIEEVQMGLQASAAAVPSHAAGMAIQPPQHNRPATTQRQQSSSDNIPAHVAAGPQQQHHHQENKSSDSQE